jgi:unsaturated rhamnogalacturonyl hydrolase
MSTVQPQERPLSPDRPWSARMADSMLKRHVPAAAQWHYEHGLLLQAIEQVGRATGEARFRDHVKATVDLFIDSDGSIRTYNLQDYNLDQINPGKRLLALHDDTGDERYKQAAALLRQQLAHQPRTRSGGF